MRVPSTLRVRAIVEERGALYRQKHKTVVAMRPLRVLTRVRRLSLKPVCSLGSLGFYHTYPDPNDKGSVSSTKAADLDVQKQLDKSGGEFGLDEKFRMDSVFPGIPQGKKIGDQPAPLTKSSKLDNGLTVASQDMPGLMTSFAFIVKSGSSYEMQTGTTQMLELSSFKSTKNRSHQRLLKFVSKA